MLYQLSYGIIIEVAKIEIFYKKPQAFKQTVTRLSKTTDSQQNIFHQDLLKVFPTKYCYSDHDEKNQFKPLKTFDS